MEYFFLTLKRSTHRLPKLGFTLVELLIVIAIIGILVSVSTVSYTSAQKKTRDTRRRNDLKAIQNAYEQYYADNNGSYPASCTLSDTTYLPAGMPVDPKSSQGYHTQSGMALCSALSYCFCAALEGDVTSASDCSGSARTGIYCVRSLQ